MKYLLFLVVLAGAYFIGVFGFCQIIGSLQNILVRPPMATVFTTVLWIGILLGVFFLVKHFLNSQIIALYIGYGISLVMALRAGKIS